MFQSFSGWKLGLRNLKSSECCSGAVFVVSARRQTAAKTTFFGLQNRLWRQWKKENCIFISRMPVMEKLMYVYIETEVTTTSTRTSVVSTKNVSTKTKRSFWEKNPFYQIQKVSCLLKCFANRRSKALILKKPISHGKFMIEAVVNLVW